MLDKVPKGTVAGDYDRRWISDDYFDLMVWYTPGDAIHGFQLCYDKPRWERALTWLSDRGFSHMEVDSGEDDPHTNRAPVLVPDGSFPAETVLAEFARRATALPRDLRKLVTEKISEFVRRRV
jgi:hypothetical protein